MWKVGGGRAKSTYLAELDDRAHHAGAEMARLAAGDVIGGHNDGSVGNDSVGLLARIVVRVNVVVRLF